MKLFFFIITLIIYQYFISRIAIDARPAEVKKFSWNYPIHDYQEDDFMLPLVKRKGVGKFNLCSFFSISSLNRSI
jgi:hypothetical protein